MVKLDYTVLNAFTTSEESGNPAAVITLPAPTGPIDPADPFKSYPPTEALQKVATEINLPMTAFLLPQDISKGQYLLRWLDSGTEVQLCGHATVALSQHLFSSQPAPGRLELTTVKHGLVISENLPTPFDGDDKRVGLDFPEILGFEAVERSSERWEEVIKGLEDVSGKHGLPVEAILKHPHYIIVEFAEGFDMSANGLPLDLDKLGHFEGFTLLLTQPSPTAKETNGPHIHTRVLHALSKKTEDAATGSAHCALIPYYLTSKQHRSTFSSHAVELGALSVVQQSPEGGEMVVQWLKDRKKVRIFGNAIHVGTGEVELDV